jgi:hypothetical protein
LVYTKKILGCFLNLINCGDAKSDAPDGRSLEQEMNYSCNEFSYAAVILVCQVVKVLHNTFIWSYTSSRFRYAHACPR